MKYKQWIEQTEVEMTSLGLEQLLEMSNSIPIAEKEVDHNKQEKLCRMVLFFCSGAVLLTSKLQKDIMGVCKNLLNVFPYDSPMKTYAQGCFDVLQTTVALMDKIEEMKK